MFHFTQFRPESTRQRRLHQNSERHERCRRQEDVCYLESEFFAETLLLLLSAVRHWSRRSYISFENFFSSSVQFLSARSFHKTRNFVTFSSIPFILAPALSCYFQWTDRAFLADSFFFANSKLAWPASSIEKLWPAGLEHRLPTESWKVWSFSSLKISGKNFFGLLVWKKKVIFQSWSFDMRSDNVLF